MASILIVEDEAAINELVKRNLQLVGHQCHCIFDGKSAVSEIQRQSYDLMILDIMLPELNGFEVIKQANETPTILDLMALTFLFFPLYVQQEGEFVRKVNLFALQDISAITHVIFFVFPILMALVLLN